MRVVKATAVQLSPVLYSREGTVEKVAILKAALLRANTQSGLVNIWQRVLAR